MKILTPEDIAEIRSEARKKERAEIVKFLLDAADSVPLGAKAVADLLRHEANGIRQGLHRPKHRGKD